MRITHDTQADALYIHLNDCAVAHTVSAVKGVVTVDVSADGTPVGIELLSPSRYVDDLSHVALETNTGNAYVGVEDMAEMHKVAPNTIHRMLRADQKRPTEKRKLPGAFKVGGERRGVWVIPRAIAEAWHPYRGV